MKWLTQFRLVMRSSLTTLRERVENPERLLHQLILDMDEDLCCVRRSVAEAIADEIQLKKRVQKEQKRVQEWHDRAERALKHGDEKTARCALEQKSASRERFENLQKEHEKQRAQTQTLHDSVRNLEDKIRQARQKRTLLLARLNRAESSRRISVAMDQANGRSAFAQFERLEDRVTRAEAIDEAWDRMSGADPNERELEEKFAAAERQEKIQEELETLRNKLQSS